MKQAVFFIVLLSLMGCSKKTATSASPIQILLVSNPYHNVMQAQVDQFTSLYPDSTIMVKSVSTRDAIVQLLNDSVHSILIDLKFNAEEQHVSQQASLRIVETRIAEDGIAFIVHPQNSLASISVETAKKIIGREYSEWNQIPKNPSNLSIDLVLTDRNSGMYELLQTKFFSSKKLIEPTAVMKDQHEVIRYVREHPQALGCVSASLIMGKSEKVKVLSITVKSPDAKEQIYYPGQEEIYLSLYPFHFSLYLYNTEAKTGLGIGFNAFVLSNIGQKIMQNAGLVPAAMPYRTIQLTTE
jgi:phosphate transport system substrate-binding protein